MGKSSYFGPWKRLTTFANQIAKALSKRFPAEDFLEALDVVDPRQWVTAHDTSYNCSMFFCCKH